MSEDVRNLQRDLRDGAVEATPPPSAAPNTDASETTPVLSLSGDDHELLTLEQVATMLKVRPSTIRHWVREGRMPCVRLGPRATRWTRPLLRQ